MLPETYEPAAVVVMVLGGALACFAGYRLFRVVLAIYGFIFGAMMASSVMGATNTFGMVVAAIVGGIVGGPSGSRLRTQRITDVRSARIPYSGS